MTAASGKGSGYTILEMSLLEVWLLMMMDMDIINRSFLIFQMQFRHWQSLITLGVPL
ncbi:hypothetical protein M0R72_01535 [Candidatus Pacearchaeota archaeon]|nr:hypothetical protein [Candidatus Pacearchaeota archaeon]